MKRILFVITLLALLAAAPVLACGGGCSGCDGKAAKVAKAEGFCMQSATKTVKNIDNGVEILFVTSNPAATDAIMKAVKDGKLLGCEGQCPTKAKNVKRDVTRTDKGVLVKATSPDAEMVQHLQAQAKKMVSNA